MKLKIDEWVSKSGASGKTVKITSLDPSGMGMCIDDTLELTFTKDPELRECRRKSDGAIFTANKLYCTIDNPPENIKNAKNEGYDNYCCQLPFGDPITNILKNCQQGDTIKVFVKENKVNGQTYHNIRIAKVADTKVAEKPVNPPAAVDEPKPKSSIAEKLNAIDIEDDDDIPF